MFNERKAAWDLRVEILEPRIMLAADAESAGEVVDPLGSEPLPIAASSDAEASTPQVAEAETKAQDDPVYDGEGAALSASQGNGSALVFIDEAVSGLEELIAAARPGYQIIVLDGVDPWAQMTDVIGLHNDISSIHIISHGTSGEITLGGSRYDASTLPQDQLSSWRDHLSLDADILLYGCDIGAGEAGSLILNAFAELTDADLAASLDKTGSSELGGDWDLESTTGTIEASLFADQATLDLYNYQLAPDLTAPSSTAWKNIMIGSNYDPINDQQSSADSDLLGNSSNAMLQAQSIVSASDTTYYFRVRVGSLANGNASTSFYLAVDLDRSGLFPTADAFIEAKYSIIGTTLKRGEINFHKADFSGGNTGYSPSTTAWLASSSNANLEYELMSKTGSTNTKSLSNDKAYLGYETTNSDLDGDGKNDYWVSFGFTLSELNNWAHLGFTASGNVSVSPRNISSTAVTGTNSVALFAFTSTSQTSNGDIAGVDDRSADLTQSWSDLGVVINSTLNNISSGAPSSPTVNSLTTADLSPVITGSAKLSDINGDGSVDDALTITVNGVTYSGAQISRSQIGTSDSYNWAVQLNDLPASGSYDVTATTTRTVSGTTTAATDLTSNELIINTSLPTQIPSIVTYTDDVSANTGTFSSSSSTNDLSPVLNGVLDSSLDPGDVVRVYRAEVGGTFSLLGDAAVSGTNWTYADTGLTAGKTYIYYATVYDGTGNGASSPYFFIGTDTTAPIYRPTITSYTDNIGSTQGTITTNGSTTDDTTPLLNGSFNSGSTYPLASGEKLAIYRGGTFVGYASVGPTLDASGDPIVDQSGAYTSYSWTYQESNLSDGTYEYKARIVDAAGNLGTESLPFLLTIDAPVSVANITVNEASSHAIFTLDGANGQLVTLSLTAGGATAGTDYSSTLEYSYDGSVWTQYSSSFTLSAAKVFVRTAITNDPTYEGAETFTLTASSGGVASVATATITDDGTGSVYTGGISAGAPVISGTADDDRSISVTAYRTGAVNEASDYAFFTVTALAGEKVRLDVIDVRDSSGQTADLGASPTLFYSINNGLSWSVYASGSDLTVPSGGSFLVRTDITLEQDSIAEGSETFALRANYATNTAKSGSASVTIYDDATGEIFSSDRTLLALTPDYDQAGFSISPSSSTTSEAGGSDTFDIVLTSQPTANVTVTLSGLDATEGTLSTATLTFTAANWNTVQTVTITGADDTLDDGDIAYTLAITATSSDANYNGRTANHSVTNTDNDSEPVIAVSDAVASEGDGFLVFTVTRSGATGGTTQVDYVTSDGTANSSDYAAATGQVVFAPGETSKTVSIAINDDATLESTETITLTLSNIVDSTSSAERIGTSVSTGSINDNDSTNAAPVGVADTYTTTEDTALTVTAVAGVLANDTDADNDSLTAVLVTPPSNGTLTLNANGSFTYTPNAHYNGADSFTYKTNDGSADGATTTVTLTVTAVDDSFTDSSETVTVQEDSTNNTGNLLTGTSSVDGGVSIASFSIAGEAGPFTLGSAYTVTGKGTITIGSDGSYSFTPVANYNGSFPAVSYAVTDGSGSNVTSTLTISVASVDDSFTDSSETVTVQEDSTNNTGNLLTGTSSVDGGVSIASFSIAGEAGPFTLGSAYTVTGKGTITIGSDGSYSFTPVANYNGSFPAVSYAVTDGSGSNVTSTLTISVASVDDSFTDSSETVTVQEDSTNNTGNLLTGTSSVDGGVSIASFSIAGEAGPFTLGSAYTVTGKGTITIGSDGSYSFTPVANYNGSFPAVSYAVTDGSGSNVTSTLTISVASVDDSFTDSSETVTVQEDSTNNTGNLLTGTSSVDGGVSIASFSIAGEAGPFTLGSAYTVTGKGTITIGSDGSYSFTPVANYNGSFPAVSYAVTDGSGSNVTSTLTISVASVDDSFTDSSETVTVQEDSTNNTGNLLTGTSSVDGGVSIASFSIAGEAGPFTLGSAYTVTGKGTITIGSDGSYSFTPVANYNGSFPAVSYAVTDGSGSNVTSTLTISVASVDDSFTDSSETVTVQEDSTNNTGNLLTGTSSVDGGVSIASFSIAGEAGPFTLGSAYTVTGKGTITIGSDGSYSFTPVANYNGSFPAVSYAVTDGSGSNVTSTLTISVASVDDSFTDSSETVTVQEDSTNNTGNLLTGTSSVDGGVSIASFSIAGEAGPFTLGSAYTVTGKGTITIGSDGSYSFTPVANYNGSFPAVSYAVTDGSGSNVTSTLTISVAATSPAPVPLNPPTITNVTDTFNDPTPTDLVTGDTTQVLTVEGTTGATGFILYTINGSGNASVYGRNIGAFVETSPGIYSVDLQTTTLPAGTYSIAFEYSGGVGSQATNSFVVDSTPALHDRIIDRVLVNSQTGVTTGQLALLDQSRVDLTPSEPGVSLLPGSGKLAAILPQWFDIDGDTVNFGIVGITPVAGVSSTTLASGSTLEINALNGTYEYRPGGGSGTDIFSVFVQDPQGQGGTLRLIFNPNDTLDRDGIPLQAETNLAKLIMGSANNGDLNGDGVSDAEQNAVATLAWITNDNFQAGVVYAGAGAAPPTQSIIYIAVSQGASGVETTSQLTDITVLSTAAGSSFTGGRPSAVNISTTWDPIQFAIEPLESLGLRDADPNASGVQAIVEINISNSQIPVSGGFNAYMKYISSETIQAYLNAGLPLVTLDGESLTSASQAGWYDFTQRNGSGDGARFIDSNNDGLIDFIRLQITDNRFGDNDPRVDRILDPGVPVLRGVANAAFTPVFSSSAIASSIAPAAFVIPDYTPSPYRPIEWQGPLAMQLDFDTTPASFARGLSSLMMPNDPMNVFLGSDLVDSAVCSIDPAILTIGSYLFQKDGTFSLGLETLQSGRYAFEGLQLNNDPLPDWVYVNPFSGEITGRFPNSIDQYDLIVRQYDDCGIVNDIVVPLRRDAEFLRAYAPTDVNDHAIIVDYILLKRDGQFVLKLRNTTAEAINISDIRMAQGQALPAWMHFDAQATILSGVLPVSITAIDLVLVVQTSAGSEIIPFSFQASPEGVATSSIGVSSDPKIPLIASESIERGSIGFRPFSLQLKDALSVSPEVRQ